MNWGEPSTFASTILQLSNYFVLIILMSNSNPSDHECAPGQLAPTGGGIGLADPSVGSIAQALIRFSGAEMAESTGSFNSSRVRVNLLQQASQTYS
jgi:hypothetical protein